ncbi:hypothetical protein [Lentzea sp.]|uniref:hypothetical protein n=1 Tax=Lentzea sp. TaxID=56099 RepID=UPI002ED00CD9
MTTAQPHVRLSARAARPGERTSRPGHFAGFDRRALLRPLVLAGSALLRTPEVAA